MEKTNETELIEQETKEVVKEDNNKDTGMSEVMNELKDIRQTIDNLKKEDLYKKQFEEAKKTEEEDLPIYDDKGEYNV